MNGETHTTTTILAFDWYIFSVHHQICVGCCRVNVRNNWIEKKHVRGTSKERKKKKGTHIGRVSCTCDKDQFGRAHLGPNRTVCIHRRHCCAFLVASRSICRLRLHSQCRTAFFTLTSNSGLIIFLANASFTRIYIKIRYSSFFFFSRSVCLLFDSSMMSGLLSTAYCRSLFLVILFFNQWQWHSQRAPRTALSFTIQVFIFCFHFLFVIFFLRWNVSPIHWHRVSRAWNEDEYLWMWHSHSLFSATIMLLQNFRMSVFVVVAVRFYYVSSVMLRLMAALVHDRCTPTSCEDFNRSCHTGWYGVCYEMMSLPRHNQVTTIHEWSHCHHRRRRRLN